METDEFRQGRVSFKKNVKQGNLMCTLGFHSHLESYGWFEICSIFFCSCLLDIPSLSLAAMSFEQLPPNVP